VLYAGVVATGERFGEDPATYTAGAVARFAGGARDEDWVGLLGAMERSQQPGQTFLAHAIRWALARDTADGEAHTCCGSCPPGTPPEQRHGAGP
jgi:hypothetical protein